jgi:peptidoglycan/xylan/chitin deacetylase (PgdA/CDA1 family)
MCQCQIHQRAVPSRRQVLGGLAGAFGATLVAHAAGSAPLSACWTPAELAGTSNERLGRHATAADAFATPAPAAPGPAVTGALAGVIRRVDLPAGERLVALTFDLCQTLSPIAGYDGAIVDYLRAADVPATFFPSGRWLMTHTTRAMQLAADPLFELGNHSWSHPDLHSAGADHVANEILLTETALGDIRIAARATCPAEALSVNPLRIFRFPYGSCSETSLAAANTAGEVVIQWDVVSGDPDGTPARAIIRNVMAHVRPGSIVVMHANGRGTHTAEALRTLVPQLRAEGYRFATVSALLAAGRPEAAKACYIDHPGDTVVYDTRTPRHLATSAPAHHCVSPLGKPASATANRCS